MPNKNHRELAAWCLSNATLQGKKLRHPGLGMLHIVAVTREGLRIAGRPFLVSPEFILKEFESLFSASDIAELRDRWIQEERGARLREAEEVEQARLAAERVRENRRRALEEAQRRLLAIKEFIGLTVEASSDPLPSRAFISPPIPTEADWNLIRAWMAQHVSSESEERRMLSARLAEKAVASFYETKGHTVRDVSLTQLSPGATEWKLYDLQVDGFFLDVKNARRSRKNRNRYVNYCVPRFKEHRSSATVGIAGVLSSWLPVSEMVSPDNKVLFLGLTDIHKLGQIQQMLVDGPLVMTLKNGLQGPNFLPPWLFSYPDGEYESRNTALAGLKELEFPDWRSCAEVHLSPLPAFIAAGRSYSFSPAPPLSEDQMAFVDLLLARQQDFGLSLPIVFLSLLEHFLDLLRRETTVVFNEDEYARLIFPTQDRSHPYFLYDPLDTVSSLLTTLSTLGARCSSTLKGFREFRLHNLNVLVGKRANDSQWITLLAYCGGWIKEPKLQPCGMTPLVFGQCETCSCGRLICPNCGFCSRDCPYGKTRTVSSHEAATSDLD